MKLKLLLSESDICCLRILIIHEMKRRLPDFEIERTVALIALHRSHLPEPGVPAPYSHQHILFSPTHKLTP